MITKKVADSATFFCYINTKLLLNNFFCNLYCIKCCTFTDLIAYTPECNTIFICQVSTNTSHIHIICSTEVKRHRIRECRGILITGFNGGNTNGATGDFSFGIEGYLFENGNISHPIKEMNMTGNILSLWHNVTNIGTDYRECSRWRILNLLSGQEFWAVPKSPG